MYGSDQFEALFVISAFLFQVILIGFFAMRKWRFNQAMKAGPVVYALSLPAAAVSVAILANGKNWEFWLAGFIYLVWAIFGFTIEYILKITDWRQTFHWPVFIPYIFLYLATTMFYWWPLALIAKPLWTGYAVLFVISTIFNMMSHKHTGEINAYQPSTH